jgi:uncharacterized membrane protein
MDAGELHLVVYLGCMFGFVRNQTYQFSVMIIILVLALVLPEFCMPDLA